MSNEVNQVNMASGMVNVVRYVNAKYQFEHDYWSRLVALTNGNVTRMAELSGVNRTDLYKKLDRASVTIKRHGPSRGVLYYKGNSAWHSLGDE